MIVLALHECHLQRLKVNVETSRVYIREKGEDKHFLQLHAMFDQDRCLCDYIENKVHIFYHTTTEIEEDMWALGLLFLEMATLNSYNGAY